MAFLYHLDEDGTLAQCWEVTERPLLVGRGDFAGACVADSSLSRAHFLVLPEAKEFFVVDLESQNGTWMNGEAVLGRRLHEGDVIKAGESLFMFSRRRLSSDVSVAPVSLPERPHDQGIRIHAA